ncbi:MAG: hypothetical protein ACTSYI_05260 [Promethearchaeota archaeon]
MPPTFRGRSILIRGILILCALNVLLPAIIPMIQVSLGTPTFSSSIPEGSPRSNAPSLSFYQLFSLNDYDGSNTLGDNDHILDAGEIVDIMFQIINTGDIDATNVQAEISCEDPFVTILINNSLYNTVSPNVPILGATPFRLSVNSSCPKDHQIDITLHLSSTEVPNEEDIFSMVVEGVPLLEFLTFEVYAEYNGGLIADDDEIIDAGEEVNVYLYLQNEGHSIAFGLQGELTTLDPEIIISDGNSYFGDIAGEGDIDYGSFLFEIPTSKIYPDKQQVEFQLDVIDDWNTMWPINFTIVINGTADFDILEWIFEEKSGDEDLQIDAGELWDINLKLFNNGSAITSNYSIFVDSSDPYVIFSYEEHDRKIQFDSDYYYYYYYDDVTLYPSTSEDISSYYWNFRISPAVPLNWSCSLQIYVEDSSILNPRIFTINFSISGVPNYIVNAVETFEIIGDEDTEIDAGEIWYFSVNIENIGEANGHNLYIQIESTDEYIEFYYEGYGYNNISVGNLNVGQNLTEFRVYYWQIEISNIVPNNYPVEFSIIITDDSHNLWLDSFTIQIIDGKLIQFDWQSNIGWILLGLAVITIMGYYVYKNRQNISLSLKKYTQTHQFPQKKWIKSLRYPFKWEFQSDQPAEMLRNINNMHRYSLDLIKRKQYQKAAAVIADEIKQYSHTKTLLHTMNLENLNKKIRKKLAFIKDLEYRIKDASFTEIYQNHIQTLNRHKQRDNFNKIDVILANMQKITKNHIHYLKKIKKEQEIPKIEDLLTDLKEQKSYNSVFLKHKIIENNHNTISDLLENGKLRPAYQLIGETLSEIDGSLLEIEKVDPNSILSDKFEVISQETREIQSALLEVKSQITTNYESLIEGAQEIKLNLEKKSSQIETLQLKEKPISDINEYIQELDAQFKEWDNLSKGKRGKN